MQQKHARGTKHTCFFFSLSICMEMRMFDCPTINKIDVSIFLFARTHYLHHLDSIVSPSQAILTVNQALSQLLTHQEMGHVVRIFTSSKAISFFLFQACSSVPWTVMKSCHSSHGGPFSVSKIPQVLKSHTKMSMSSLRWS